MKNLIYSAISLSVYFAASGFNLFSCLVALLIVANGILYAEIRGEILSVIHVIEADKNELKRLSLRDRL